MIKFLNILEIEGNYLNILIITYNKPTSNIILNGEKLRAFPFISGTTKRCKFLPLLFNTTQEVLVRAMKHEEIKGFPIEKKKQNYLFSDDIHLYVKILEDPPLL